MSLDICFKELRPVVCPRCGEVVKHKVIACEIGGGSAWYPILEAIGYYVPYERRTEENDWYGKDMMLTKQQAEDTYRFIKNHAGIYGYDASGLIADALLNGNTVSVNADW